ncbi:GDP-mannose 4,6-dehydratase [Arthrobacter sp. KFRI-F3372]|uniref:GDP-mannose 4,6-dehydratase n=1 Tax=Pseudarthrobacter oxydans TaxID=1671 RepID=UPI00279D0C08|nr:GDP-mannose 4,6-dehydratase [Arthrobacter sp. KFRI-F3372]
MRTAFITGVTGQDGSYLAELLAGLGWEVHGLVRNKPDYHGDPAAKTFTEHQGDITDPSALQRVLRVVQPDIVFNLAGSTSVAKSWEDPAATISTNSTSVATLLELTWRMNQESGTNIRFVQASSAEIFGSATDVPQSEQSRICPVSPYGASKALAHNLVNIYRTRGMFASSAILYNHESPRRPMSFVTRKITSQVARIALGHPETLQLGNLDATRDWGWAPDFVDALYRVGVAAAAEDFIIATGISHSVSDFVRCAFEAAGIDEWERYVCVDPQFVRPADASEMRGNPAKARDVLGWEPTVGFKEMVARMIQHDLLIEEARLGTALNLDGKST